MKKKESVASISYQLCQKLFLPCFVLCLFTSMTLLYKNWETRNLTLKYHVTSTVPTQNRIAFVTVVTIPAKRTSTEVQADFKPKLTLVDRSSPESHTKSSEAQTDSNPKLVSTDRSLPEIQSNSPKLLRVSSPKPDTEKPSFPKSRQAALSTKLSPDVQPKIPAERRRSLLIYGADRSGTTFTTKMFAADPQLMTVYEPLWITKRWNKEDSSQIKNWKRNVLDLLKGILSCKFAESPAGIKFLSQTTKTWSGAYVNNAFQSSAFCPNGTCRDLARNPNYADKVCVTKYKHSVTKIGEPRTPDNLISSFLPMLFTENLDTDIRVIQLIRDPRASMNSRIKLGWMVDFHHWSFLNNVGRVCSNLAKNIKFGRNLGQWQDKYLEVHYRDLAGRPLETTQAMYKFAGFEMPESIRDWVIRNTSPSKEELRKQEKNIFSSVRNSTANIDKWQKESPIGRIRIIEEHCKVALDLLGLTKMT
ncbi:carbohydrate sulfotransferase 3-like [Orbicella faveolata]|uniref:carbohydrate sulfotransferase 3-like n=1 Tax=Orbicella faveolata TaxID=48498 RepID=UPI0009E41FE1|nr:carbohydrate sulfotransferase 3-like [Orbicella faveolata]